MNKKIAVITAHFYDPRGEKRLIGGVETYLDNLLEIFEEANIPCTVYQLAESGFLHRRYGSMIRGIPVQNLRELVRYAEKEHDTDRDVLLFATDFAIVKHHFRHSVAIQHGVAWDIPQTPSGDVSNYLSMLTGALRSARKYRRFSQCEYLVCVDYNFLNWYRTQVRAIPNRCVVIPSFSKLPGETARSEGDELSLIFARRLIPYRGTRLFCEAVSEVLDRHPELRVTIAGEGPDEQWMRDRLGQYNQVRFCVYAPEDSLRIHARHDIAVIPTLGSEGTSLSLLEAMAAGCAVIATQIGGMTNIVLDRYNGLLIPPEREAVCAAIEELVCDDALRRRLAEKARETVETSFSRKRWANQWIQMITSMD